VVVAVGDPDGERRRRSDVEALSAIGDNALEAWRRRSDLAGPDGERPTRWRSDLEELSGLGDNDLAARRRSDLASTAALTESAGTGGEFKSASFLTLLPERLILVISLLLAALSALHRRMEASAAGRRSQDVSFSLLIFGVSLADLRRGPEALDGAESGGDSTIALELANGTWITC
jgi:hypothetical protein